MENDSGNGTITVHNVKKQFDETLGRRMEYLIGSRYGIDALPLNLATISSIIFLNEREKEIETAPGRPSERYTYETLLNELTEIGLDSDEDLKVHIDDMIQKAYVDVDDSGRLFAKKPTVSMAKLFDRVFPNMPGMNFIAYFAQTIDEAQSGRKGFDSAMSQLDQTLQMQGVSLVQKKTKPKQKKAPRNSFKHLPNLSKIDTASPSVAGSKIISSNRDLGQVEIREIFAGNDEPIKKHEEIDASSQSPEIAPSGEVEEEASVLDFDMHDDIKETGPAELPIEKVPTPHEGSIHTSELIEKEAGLSGEQEMEVSSTETFEEDDALLKSEPPYETEIVRKGHSLSRDDGIEERIAAFEEDLAMQCPLCRRDKVEAKQTATGRTYYKCANKDCIFISWGRPYHIVCPQCHNPFLIEISNKDEKPILKCPRATCSYWQSLPGEITEEHREKDSSIEHTPKPDTLTAISRKPRRKVVRRRVVRRKR
jgi:hypothetical protein